MKLSNTQGVQTDEKENKDSKKQTKTKLRNFEGGFKALGGVF